MSERPEINSPFALLDEVEEAKEVLVLSYTSDLAFFERVALAHARGLGAVVTLVSDARWVAADPMITRRAGSTYLDARAVCPGGAFHPKLVVVAGERQARVAIGSGNLTMAGWHGNAEIWTVLRCGPGGGSRTMSAVAGFLRALGDSPVLLGPGAAEGLDRVADRLDAFSGEEPGPVLLHNLEQPILGRLPAGPVDELVLSAPFYDRRLRAMRALVERLQPRRLGVYVEPRTSVDGLELSAFLDDCGGELCWIADQRYHHGKLAQWRTGEAWTALTGSANLSAPALMASVAGGGNCELALLGEGAGATVPEAGPAPHDAVALSFREDDQPAEDAPALLAALRDGDGIRLSLARQLDEPGRAQLYDNAIDGWRSTTRLEAGGESYMLPAETAPPGAALRIFLDRGVASNRVFVTDLARVQLPPPAASARARTSIELIAALGLEQTLLDDLEELRPHLLRVGALPEADAVREPARPQTIDDLLATHEPILGRELTEFALVLPSLPGMGIDADEELDPAELDLGEEEPGGEVVVDPEDGDGGAGDDLAAVLRERSPHERARFRRFVERLIASASDYPPVVATLTLRTHLHGIAAELWDEEDVPPLLEKSVLALADPVDRPAEAERRAAATLAAVGVAMLRSRVEQISIRDEATLRYERALAAVRPLFGEVDRERLERLAPELPEPLRGDAAEPAVEEVLAEAAAPATGPERSVRLLAAEYELDASVDASGAIVFEQPLPDAPQPLLLRALGFTAGPGPAVARGRTAKGIEVVACWRAPQLAIEYRGRRSWGRLYRLPGTLSPLSFSGLDDGLPPPVQRWELGEPPGTEAVDLLAEAG